MPRVTVLIGQPGSGKSTVLRAAGSHLGSANVAKPIPHRARLDRNRLRYVELGRGEGGFPGTDTLGMNVQPAVIRWLTGPAAPPHTVAEGDRLGNRSFVEALREAGCCVDVILLDTPDDVAAGRRAARGSTQNATWLAGRLTKVTNLTDLVTARLDGNLPIGDVAADLRLMLTAE